MAVPFNLVIARYNEPLDWLEDAVKTLSAVQDGPRLNAVFVYNKGPVLGDELEAQLANISEGVSINLIALPNVGREGHTYLHHIIDRYHSHEGPEVTVFMQGDPRDHLVHYGTGPDASIADFIRSACEDASINGVNKSMLGRLPVSPNFKISVHNGRPVGAQDPLTFSQWFTQNVSQDYPNAILWWVGAMFAVTASNIKSRSLDFYANLLAKLAEHCDPECGHFLERSWYYILDRSAIDYTLIPFFMGPDMDMDTDGHSSRSLRPAYLRHTLANAVRLTRKRVYVGVCNEHDRRLVTAAYCRSGAQSFVQVVEIANLQDPKLLPLSLCVFAQRNAGVFLPTDIMYFTAADQVLCAKGLEGHIRRMRAVPLGSAVLVPHRFEEMFRGHGVRRGMTANVFKHMYVLPNADPVRTNAPGAVLPPGLNAASYQRTYYNAKTANEAYSAAYIAEFQTIQRVPYMVHHNLPLESASFSVFYTGRDGGYEHPEDKATGSVTNVPVSCIKTSDATQLFVIHIGGFEHHARMAKETIKETDLFVPPPTECLTH